MFCFLAIQGKGVNLWNGRIRIEKTHSVSHTVNTQREEELAFLSSVCGDSVDISGELTLKTKKLPIQTTSLLPL